MKLHKRRQTSTVLVRLGSLTRDLGSPAALCLASASLMFGLCGNANADPRVPTPVPEALIIATQAALAAQATPFASPASPASPASTASLSPTSSASAPPSSTLNLTSSLATQGGAEGTGASTLMAGAAQEASVSPSPLAPLAPLSTLAPPAPTTALAVTEAQPSAGTRVAVTLPAPQATQATQANQATGLVKPPDAMSWHAKAINRLAKAGGLGLNVARLIGKTISEDAVEIVASAVDLIGIPYRWGGESIEDGFDCSGMIKHVYESSIGLVLPRTAAEQAKSQSLMKVDKEALEPGDLVFFKTTRKAFSHVGLYVGDGQFVHAPRTGADIRVESIKSSYWSTRFNGARRSKP